jgi:hypothetical protein
MKKYENETVFPVKRKEERTTAAHFDNVWTIFLLPVGAGFIVFLATLFISVGNPRMSGGTAFVMGGLTMIGVLVWLLSVSKRILWSTEEITEYDWDRDGHIGEPPQQITRVQLPTGPHSFKVADISYSYELLSDWCEAALNGKSLSFASWQGRFALPDGTQGKERYREFRDWLCKQGYADEVGGNIGLRIRWRNQEAQSWVGGFACPELIEATPLLPSGEDENDAPHS